MTSYLDSERHLYTPPDCPGCGNRVQQEWVDVTTEVCVRRTGERSFMPGLWRCNTQGCQYGPPNIEPERKAIEA